MVTKTAKKNGKQAVSENGQMLTLSEFAHEVISEQYRSVVKLEKKVLADKEPENLHHMRVGTRRLRTALQVMGNAVKLPKAAQEKQISSLAKVLGNLRDFDVQIADLKEVYRPRLNKSEQAMLDDVIARLQRERRHAYAAVKDALTRSRYQDLKAAYETWLDEPQYTILAQLPLKPLLPDLLSPLLSSLLLHPGWLIQSTDLSEEADYLLHELRKACKHARYQAEFFVPFYGKPFKEWIGEVKTIQDSLGKVHDGQVLLDLLTNHLPNKAKISSLQSSVRETQAEMLENWESVRQKYLNFDFRHHLHEMLLNPVGMPESA